MQNQKSSGLKFKSDPDKYLPTDEELTEEICQLFYDHPHIDSGNINVWVTNGQVTLAGTVPHEAMRHLAEVLVRDIPGVTQVTNQLTHSPYEVKRNPNRLLATAVRTHLTDTVAHPSGLEINAENGRIPIQGIAFDKEADQILKTVSEIPGVSQIDNKLDVLTSSRSTSSADQPQKNQFHYQPEFGLGGHWSPVIRGLAVVGGVFLVAQGASQKRSGQTESCRDGPWLLRRAIQIDKLQLIGTVIMPGTQSAANGTVHHRGRFRILEELFQLSSINLLYCKKVASIIREVYTGLPSGPAK